MVSLNVSRAERVLTDTDFILDGLLIVVGLLGAQVFTEYARQHVVDLQMKGADAIYAFGSAAVVLTLAPGRYARPAALGMAGGGIAVLLEEFGVIQGVSEAAGI